MESTTGSSPAGNAFGSQGTRPGLALILALLSVPGSTAVWELFDGAGFVIGLPLALAAIALGLQARQHATDRRGMATAAIAIAGLMIAMMAVWTTVEVLS